MSKVWHEEADPEKHRDFMTFRNEGGVPIEPAPDKLIEKWVYFAEVDGFTFQFASLAQVTECRDYFAEKMHPSTREPGHELEHYWQPWHARLPKGLNKGRKRKKVVKAMDQILKQWVS